MSKWIKNDTVSDKTWLGQTILAGEYYLIQAPEEVTWSNDSTLLSDIASGDAVVAKDNSGSNDVTDVNDAINYLKDGIARAVDITSSVEPHPFAAPSYRTKRDATLAKATVTVNTSSAIDFKLITEKYVSGGKMIIKNAEFEDYCTAEVYDKDSVIPEAYRVALCESWPTVSTYVVKEWIDVCGGSICEHTINTKPLNAKITAGLYLRVTYHATAAGSDREVLINYDLTQKLV